MSTHRFFPVFRFLALLTLAFFLTAGTAQSHSVLVTSDPEDGSTVDSIENGVTLTFNENIQEPAFVTVSLEGESQSVDAEIEGTNVVAPLAGVVDAPGDIVVAYRVVSADGHPIEGIVEFSYEPQADTDAEPTASEPTPTEAAPSDTAEETVDESGTSAWTWIGLALVIVALAAAVWFARNARDEN